MHPPSTPPPDDTKTLRLGLGESIRRLLDLEIRYRHGSRNETLIRERDLLLEALDRVQLDVGFDCNGDGIPDTVEIFQRSAETSCCRIQGLERVPERRHPLVAEPSVVLTDRVTPPPPAPVEDRGFLGGLFGRDKKKK